MTFFWSTHSLQRIKDRNLSRSLISGVISKPDHVNVLGDFQYEAYKKFGRKYLKVVYSKRKNHYIIITVYYIDRIKLI